MLTTTEERKMAGKLSENGTSEKSLTTEYYLLKNEIVFQKQELKKRKSVHTCYLVPHNLF